MHLLGLSQLCVSRRTAHRMYQFVFIIDWVEFVLTNTEVFGLKISGDSLLFVLLAVISFQFRGKV